PTSYQLFPYTTLFRSEGDAECSDNNPCTTDKCDSKASSTVPPHTPTHQCLPHSPVRDTTPCGGDMCKGFKFCHGGTCIPETGLRSEEHTSELQSRGHL